MARAQKKLTLSPEAAVDNLRRYVRAKGFTLSEPAVNVFCEAEAIGSRMNVGLYHQVFVLALINALPELRTVMLRECVSPEDAIQGLQRQLNEESFDPYSSETLYSGRGYRGSGRQEIIDAAMAVAWSRDRTEIVGTDVLEALLECHADASPAVFNGDWSDDRLHTPFLTLSHIKGVYDPALWVTFDQIRQDLGLLTPSAARQIPLDRAPRRLKASVMDLLSEHPNYLANCFLIMPFRRTPFHSEVESCLRQTLRNLGLNLLRADDKAYSEDVLSNIETYIHGCRFSVAVHDRFLSDEHNANVALEVGYCMGMRKPVCLLKEQTVKALPSDLHGRIYVSFDGTRIQQSLDSALSKWLFDRRITVAP